MERHRGVEGKSHALGRATIESTADNAQVGSTSLPAQTILYVAPSLCAPTAPTANKSLTTAPPALRLQVSELLRMLGLLLLPARMAPSTAADRSPLPTAPRAVAKPAAASPAAAAAPPLEMDLLLTPVCCCTWSARVRRGFAGTPRSSSHWPRVLRPDRPLTCAHTATCVGKLVGFRPRVSLKT